MRLNVIIGGKAGQGINKTSGIVADVLVKQGYFIFNYRDYQSLIRGGHNFNTLCISDEPILSHDSVGDVLIAMDDRTLKTHKSHMKKNAVIITADNFIDEGRNLNIALAGALMKILGFSVEILTEEVRKVFPKNEKALESAKKGFDKVEAKYSFGKLNNKIMILSGSEAVAVGARASGLDVYIAYPMTPSTNALHAMASNQIKDKMMVFQAEGEIAVANMALGASFAGAKTMVGTSGGGFDLMSEALSMQGMSEIPLTVYLASRMGPGTGVPTYTSQADLGIALHAGHGEFSRAVVAPANPTEVSQKICEALFLSEKFRSLSIVLSDKHLAESEYSFLDSPLKFPQFKINRKVAGEGIVKASSYESDKFGNSTESYILTEKNVESRLKKYEKMSQYVRDNFEMIKFHGNKKSKNLIVTWGSTTNAVIDAVKGLDYKVLQVIYMKPMSNEIKKEIEKAENVVLIECNSIGQLGRLIREKTGFEIKNKLLKYNGRPFHCDELKKYLEEVLNGFKKRR